jgi:FhaA, N-terminal domain/FHA domain
MGLQQFEQRLERLVEGAFAKAFRGELQPVELGRRLTREMDLRRSVSVRGFIVPNCFQISLSRADYEHFGGFVDVLQRELADAAREHARAEGYSFPGPVEIEIGWNAALQKSTFAISGALKESETRIVGWIIRPDGDRLPVAEVPVAIGRLPDNTISLQDPNVSRHHAEVRNEGEVAVLVDLHSTNGTRVNGARVTDHVLRSGDVITVGRTSFRYEAE